MSIGPFGLVRVGRTLVHPSEVIRVFIDRLGGRKHRTQVLLNDGRLVQCKGYGPGIELIMKGCKGEY